MASLNIKLKNYFQVLQDVVLSVFKFDNSSLLLRSKQRLIKSLTFTNFNSAVIIRRTLDTMESLGFFNLQDRSNKKRRILQTMYVFTFNFIMGLILGLHLLSTFTRSIRSTLEFLHTILDDVFLIQFLFVINYTRVRYYKLETIVTFMETSFSKVDTQVIRKYEKLNRTIIIIFSVVATCQTLVLLTELKQPMSNKDVEMERQIYQTKNPERKHPFRVLVPFVDETQSWTYEIVLLFQLYSIFVLYILRIMGFFYPIIILALHGQYMILCNHIKKIGNNLETDNFESFEHKMESASCSRMNEKNLFVKRKEEYERYCIKEIVKFHYKLMTFTDELTDMFSTSAAVIWTANALFLSLGLLEMVLFQINISSMGQFFALFLRTFFMSNLSEILDNCHIDLRSTLICHFPWGKVSNSTRRDLCMILRRLQGPNHISHLGGLLILSRVQFLQLVKMSYNAVSFVGAVQSRLTRSQF
ncbi:hypothetical protein WDU94_003389 [Cyamophila willieti]